MPVYTTDRLAMEHGHFVLRTPVRHCELNPIELIWVDEKSYVGRNNISFKLSDVKRLVHEAFVRIDRFVWQKAERHALDIEEQYRLSNGAYLPEIEPIVINIDSEDSDSDSVSE